MEIGGDAAIASHFEIGGINVEHLASNVRIAQHVHSGAPREVDVNVLELIHGRLAGAAMN